MCVSFGKSNLIFCMRRIFCAPGRTLRLFFIRWVMKYIPSDFEAVLLRMRSS